MKRIKRFIKNYKYSIPAAILLIIIVGVVATHGNKQVKAETVLAAKSTVAQEIEVTGRVVPADHVDLSIQAGGKVVAIPAKVGEKVSAGRTLLRVDSADLEIRLGRQQAALEKTELALAKQEPKTNAQDDLTTAYEDGFSAVANAFIDLPVIVEGASDILYDPFHSPYMSDTNVRNMTGNDGVQYKEQAGRMFDAARARYDANLNAYKLISRNADQKTIEAMIDQTYTTTKALSDAIKGVINVINYLENHQITSAELTTDKASLNTYTTEANTHLSALIAIRNTIKDSRTGINDEASDIQGSKIDIRQAELDIEDTRVQINNRAIKAPFDGVITTISAEMGETISPNAPIISVISLNHYEIDANVPEADVAKIKVGADTDVTLDAYGSDVVFKAKVVSINPAETLIDGVATYKTIFQFVDADERIKSGMTASLTIKGERKDNVIAVPQRSVITKGDAKFVQVMNGEKIIDRPVETGLRGSDGNIEIVTGIKEGDKVVVFSDQK